jgi:hypothetical protein
MFTWASGRPLWTSFTTPLTVVCARISSTAVNMAKMEISLFIVVLFFVIGNA